MLFSLWIICERTPPQELFFTFQDNARWGTIGLACPMGFRRPTVMLIEYDSACHLGEDMEDASKVLPIAMTATIVVNYILGFIMSKTILTVLGDFNQILADCIGP